LIQQSGDIMLF